MVQGFSGIVAWVCLKVSYTWRAVHGTEKAWTGRLIYQGIDGGLG